MAPSAAHDDSVSVETPDRLTQAERRARTRAALLKAAAHGISQHGYTNLVLERVASEAGYSRGALYHQFANKEELTLAVVKGVEETLFKDLDRPVAGDADPVGTLLAAARGHSFFNHNDVAGVMVALKAEFGESDHPVARALKDILSRVVAETTRLIIAGRRSGAIPPGPPPRTLALGLLGVLEGVGVHLSGQAPFDIELAERAARGVLGLAPQTGPLDTA